MARTRVKLWIRRQLWNIPPTLSKGLERVSDLVQTIMATFTESISCASHDGADTLIRALSRKHGPCRLPAAAEFRSSTYPPELVVVYAGHCLDLNLRKRLVHAKGKVKRSGLVRVTSAADNLLRDSVGAGGSRVQHLHIGIVTPLFLGVLVSCSVF